MVICFKDCVDDKQVLVNVLRKYFEITHNHWLEILFPSEQIDFDLFSWISVYFFMCHSLLNQCLQNGHWLESA